MPPSPSGELGQNQIEKEKNKTITIRLYFFFKIELRTMPLCYCVYTFVRGETIIDGQYYLNLISEMGFSADHNNTCIIVGA